MSIEKTKHGEYRVRWREGSKNRSKVVGVRKADAVAFEQEVKRGKRLGTLAHLEMGNDRLLDFVTDRWTPNFLNTKERKTQATYVSSWNRHINPHLGQYRLAEVNAERIDEWLATLRRNGVGTRAQQMAYQVLSTILAKAENWDRLARNPISKVAKPKHTTKTVVPPTPLEVERIRLRLLKRPGDATLVSVLAYAGLRPAEAVALTWSDVRERTIRIWDEKRDEDRSVDLWAPLRMDLAEWRLASGAKYELVFPRRDGRMMTETGWGNWRDRVWDEDYPPKNLRHTHSSLMIREDKLSIVEQAYQAGHSTQVHLDTYAHLFNELKGKGSAEDAIRAARLEVRSADAQEGTG